MRAYACACPYKSASESEESEESEERERERERARERASEEAGGAAGGYGEVHALAHRNTVDRCKTQRAVAVWKLPYALVIAIGAVAKEHRLPHVEKTRASLGSERGRNNEGSVEILADGASHPPAPSGPRSFGMGMGRGARG
jgi:hypothetical protein